MKLAKFNTFEEARAKMNEFNVLAKHPSCGDNFELDAIRNSQDGSFWWFDFSSCIENGGLGKENIAAQENQLQIYEFEQIPSQWLGGQDA